MLKLNIKIDEEKIKEVSEIFKVDKKINLKVLDDSVASILPNADNGSNESGANSNIEIGTPKIDTSGC